MTELGVQEVLDKVARAEREAEKASRAIAPYRKDDMVPSSVVLAMIDHYNRAQDILDGKR